jgi:CdiI immunity protein
MPRSAKATADDYPQLEAFFCGYLHQDFPEEHGTVAGAVAAFRRDARAPERRAVKKEWKAFRAATAGETLKAVGEKLTRGLGGAWTPRKRVDLEALDLLIKGL